MKEIKIELTRHGNILTFEGNIIFDDYRDSIFLLLLNFACKYNWKEKELKTFCDNQINFILEELRKL